MKDCHQNPLLYTLLILLITSLTASAQKLDHVLGDILINIDLDRTPHFLERELSTFNGIDVTYEQVCSLPMNIWLVKFDYNSVNEIQLLDELKSIHGIKHAQYNHLATVRKTPNDAEFENQWQYINIGDGTGTFGADMDMDLAWDIATGGLTAQGDTIVVCVIDDGLDINHEDLKENLWRNYNEIPNNGIDDDNNGYIDDYLGWNSKEDNDNVDFDDHGTSVAGIVGAKGNNDIGVSGVNWDVKIMAVNAIPSAEDGIIAGYSYAWTQRKLYNETDGEKGAFVVATNSSFGIGGLTAEEAPLWCEYYDALGQVGIVNVGATSNSNVDVDLVGDIPSNCKSDYLVVVTNLTWSDVKNPAAGYGAQSVDVGAYGQFVYTTYRDNSYSDFFEGTSAACPHVTGVAALLYSTDCDRLVTEAKNNPSGAALAVKNYILNGVLPNESLENITTTEGKLNAATTLQLGVDACGECPAPIAFTVEDVMPFAVMLNWSDVSSADFYNIRYRVQGQTTWTDLISNNSSILISDLMSCTMYEAQIQTSCSGTTSEFGFIQNIMTSGCCELPESISAEADGSSLLFDWTEDEFTSDYVFEYRIEGADNWTSIIVDANSYELENVPPCTTYEARIRSRCEDFDSQSDIGDIFLATSECGSCTGPNYCAFTDAKENEAEWIAGVEFADIKSITEAENNGYGNYLGGESTALKRGSIYPIVLTPDFSSSPYDEYFTVWIDWNQDQVFDEVEELAYDPGVTTNEAIMGNVFIPEDAELGSTRMRVIMSFENKEGPCDPGSSFRFGEVEDYCVEVIKANSTEDLLDGLIINPINNPVSQDLFLSIISESKFEIEASIYDIEGRKVNTSNLLIPVGKSEHKIDCTMLTNGVHVVNVSDGKVSTSFKVVKM